MTANGEERLQKFLARLGVASRRRAEELISSGRVQINGKVVDELGSKVRPGKDIVSLDGKDLKDLPPLRYILLNKPAGWITSLKDERGRRVITELLGGVEERVYPVGRLDYSTSGLLLLTNDGALTHNLLHPSKEVTKTYRAEVAGDLSPRDLRQLQEGIQLEDGLTAPAKAKIVKKTPKGTLVEITIHEGKNRQIRRMLQALEYEVIHLKRVGFAFLSLEGLPLGKWRYLQEDEVARLKALGAVKKPRRSPQKPKAGRSRQR